jgi:hypothetical protein
MAEDFSKGETKIRFGGAAKNSTNVADSNLFLCGNSYNFYMDISDDLMYIKSDTCPPLYRYLGV